MGNIYLTKESRRLLGRIAVGRENNLDLVRLGCAIMVLVGHGFMIFTNDPDDPDPVISAIYAAQAIGLEVFFVLSGFLITRSALRTQSAAAFWTSRAARILPGLIVASVFSALVIGPLATTIDLSAYISDPAVPLYILGTGLLTLSDLQLPGVFEAAPNPGDVNIPIWTLRYEIAFYAAAWIAAIVGLLTRRTVLLVIPLAGAYIAVLLSGLDNAVPTLWHLTRFGSAFGLGALAWLYRAQVPLSWLWTVVLLMAAFVLRDTPAAPVLSIVASGYMALMVGYAVPCLRAYHRVGDLSYGVYIYHWPIGSLLFAFVSDIRPLELTAATLVLSLVAASASWHFVERPALSLARRADLARFTASRRDGPARLPFARRWEDWGRWIMRTGTNS